MSSPGVQPEATVLDGRYELHDVLGRGGMADVYRATDRVLGRQVAVKLLRESAEDDNDRARFTAEARTLAGLSHSSLVTVLDAGVTSERPYLVMELVLGPTLGAVCAEGPLEADRVASVGAQVADALAYAHARGVVHRDVKPGNVLLGADGRVKLADFGIARLIGDTVRHTRTGQVIGTAAYLAPEQVTGSQVTGAADVYSLGLVLLEALTGERAFPGGVTEAALARLSRGPEVPASVPGHWRDLVLDMTSLEPDHRPSAAEVAARLRTATAEPGPLATARLPEAAALPPEQPRTSVIDRAGDALASRPAAVVHRLRGLDQHQRGLAGALLALVALILVVAVASRGPEAEPDIPDDTPAELRQPLIDLHDAVEGR